MFFRALSKYPFLLLKMGVFIFFMSLMACGSEEGSSDNEVNVIDDNDDDDDDDDDDDEDDTNTPTLVAFPGAEGFGANASGGRNGQVIKVTNLNTEGEGNLQAALDLKGARIIVFEVSGVIEGDVNILNSNVTIAGQTARGAGITIHGRLECDYDNEPDNIIVRHIRIRADHTTNANVDGNQYDGVQCSRSSNLIFDHVSVSGGVDENFDLYSATNVTVQWSTITRSDENGGHSQNNHNYGLINGPDGHSISVHHNLFAHNLNRNPAIANGPAEIINNVIYNVGVGFVHHNPATGSFNIIGNYFKQGGNDDLTPFFFDDENEGGGTPALDYYLANNYVDDPENYVGLVENPWQEQTHPSFEQDSIDYNWDSSIAQATQIHDFNSVPVTVNDSEQNYQTVLNMAGAFPRDIIAIEDVDEVINRTGDWGARLPSNLMAGLTPEKFPLDTDDDGIPDTWEIENGLSVEIVDSGTVLSSGYTAIEEYINELADSLISGEENNEDDNGSGDDGSGDNTNNMPVNPIMFVTQMPIPDDFTTVAATFGNHLGTIESAGRGGDLWIRYPDGSLRNLTQEAGFLNIGFVDGVNKGIAVREPSIHWNGTKALFSMVTGSPSEQYERNRYLWQIYEVEGFAQNSEALTITKLPNQPDDYNNVSPIYGTDDRVIFTSDRPFNGEAHLYPQLDEYEESPTVSGLWRFDPNVSGGDIQLLDHAPSGDFTPIIDSFGRVIFTRWDHLQRDQQAEDDGEQQEGAPYGTFNFSDESEGAIALLNDRSEVFPEHRTSELSDANLNGHVFNHFFPWQMNQDGTELEILNHSGRQELLFDGFLGASFNDDPNLSFSSDPSGFLNRHGIIQSSGGMFQIKEDPNSAGLYFGTNAAEFESHASGQLISLTGDPDLNGDEMEITFLTHPDTVNVTDSPSNEHSGLYRNPLPLSNNVLVAVHTSETRADDDEGSESAPMSRYDFRLKTLRKEGDYWVPDQLLTTGITKTISYWGPDNLVSYQSVDLWELDPVEIKAREIPDFTSTAASPLLQPEQIIFDQVDVSVSELKNYLVENNLALVVSRNVTRRDDLDTQQPYNLRVANGGAETIGTSGKIYDVDYLQFFQGDMIRGVDYDESSGRRALAQTMHGANGENPPAADAPDGSVKLGADGSMAAFVPAKRAMTWQLTDSNGVGVVRERYWVTFQPGEVRVCASCHGLNDKDQSGLTEPTNPPEALRDLLNYWKSSRK